MNDNYNEHYQINGDKVEGDKINGNKIQIEQLIIQQRRSQAEIKYNALCQVVGLTVSEMRTILNISAQGQISIDLLERSRKCHSKVEEVASFFQTHEKVRNALTYIGNLVGGTIGLTPFPIQVFDLFEANVVILREELKVMERELSDL